MSEPAPLVQQPPIQFFDRILYCKDCREPFVFTAGEQRFFHEKGFTNEPKRCKDCRRRRCEQVKAEHLESCEYFRAAEEDGRTDEQWKEVASLPEV